MLSSAALLTSALLPTPSPNARVLIVGASGGTGARALAGLLDVGYQPAQLRILTRDPHKPSLAPLRDLGMELFAADLDDPTTLEGVADGCTGCYIHSTAGDTKKLDTGEVSRAHHLARVLMGNVAHVVYNSAAAEATHGVKRIEQKHAVEDVLSSATYSLPSCTFLRANLFMEELWKSYTRPPILKGTYPFSLPPDRTVYLTSVRDMGKLAGVCLAKHHTAHEDAAEEEPAAASYRRLNVASEVTTPEGMAAAFATAQGTPCVHKRARLLRWVAKLVLPDLYEVIQFYRTSTEETDVAALGGEFPGVLTPFGAFLEETRWGDATATYEDLATSSLPPAPPKPSADELFGEYASAAPATQGKLYAKCWGIVNEAIAATVPAATRDSSAFGGALSSFVCAGPDDPSSIPEGQREMLVALSDTAASYTRLVDASVLSHASCYRTLNKPLGAYFCGISLWPLHSNDVPNFTLYFGSGSAVNPGRVFLRLEMVPRVDTDTDATYAERYYRPFNERFFALMSNDQWEPYVSESAYARGALAPSGLRYFFDGTDENMRIAAEAVAELAAQWRGFVEAADELSADEAAAMAKRDAVIRRVAADNSPDNANRERVFGKVAFARTKGVLTGEM